MSVEDVTVEIYLIDATAALHAYYGMQAVFGWRVDSGGDGDAFFTKLFDVAVVAIYMTVEDVTVEMYLIDATAALHAQKGAQAVFWWVWG